MNGQTTGLADPTAKPNLELDREKLALEFGRFLLRAQRHWDVKPEIKAAASNKFKEPIIIVFTYLKDEELVQKNRLSDRSFDVLRVRLTQISQNHKDFAKHLIEVQTRWPDLKVGMYVTSRPRSILRFDKAPPLSAGDRRFLKSLGIETY
ncbi:MAG: hypothetical protein ABI643_00870 [Candidatus Doudnabacteria bacterium]